MSKYKNWDDESDDYISFQKVSKKSKKNNQDKKRDIKVRQKAKQRERESF